MIIKGKSKKTGKPISLRCEYQIVELSRPVGRGWYYQSKIFGIYDSKTNEGFGDRVWQDFYGKNYGEVEGKLEEYFTKECLVSNN